MVVCTLFMMSTECPLATQLPLSHREQVEMERKEKKTDKTNSGSKIKQPSLKRMTV
jgi:hypothetical protein